MARIMSRQIQALSEMLDQATQANSSHQINLSPLCFYALADFLDINLDELIHYRGILILRWRKGDEVFNLIIWVWDSMNITAFRARGAVEQCKKMGCADYLESDDKSRLKHLVFRHRDELLALYHAEEKVS